jgi:hypothetical protein
MICGLHGQPYSLLLLARYRFHVVNVPVKRMDQNSANAGAACRNSCCPVAVAEEDIDYVEDQVISS